ncbi:RES family NAD+ phosphorylase [Sodalis ligni]|jgi:RES domain-containing protein|uniref:RES domain-containing protein n=1 Tax=Sodalis ligni TaxID=2697027 RepID=A0A4R1NKD3_9GAMM|nr:RES domain-containing protein [Sodalis ligni]TCL05236.1 RES domain-containing protein [Sodalis ligni]
MIFYRLTQKIHAAEAWTGYGASIYGGRWNHKGSAAVYVSTTIALASLEILVHSIHDSLMNQYSLFSIELPDDQVEYLENAYLPDDWREDPAPFSTMDLGTGWLDSIEGIALIIPSCIIPQENNAILNPLHTDFRQALRSVKEIDFSFDGRLIKQED